jgi:hypothetical protein
MWCRIIQQYNDGWLTMALISDNKHASHPHTSVSRTQIFYVACSSAGGMRLGPSNIWNATTFQQAFQASTDTLQLLHRHSEAKSRSLILSSASPATPRGCGRHTPGTAATTSALGILRCLPYELPSLSAAAMLGRGTLGVTKAAYCTPER